MILPVTNGYSEAISMFCCIFRLSMNYYIYAAVSIQDIRHYRTCCASSSRGVKKKLKHLSPVIMNTVRFRKLRMWSLKIRQVAIIHLHSLVNTEERGSQINLSGKFDLLSIKASHLANVLQRLDLMMPRERKFVSKKKYTPHYV